MPALPAAATRADSTSQWTGGLLAGPFQGLQTLRSQREASLSARQLLELQTLVTPISYRRDFLRKLPLQVVFAIFRQLPIYQSFQARQVSQTWFQILSAPQLTEAVLRPWFSGSEIAIRIPRGLSIEETLSLKAEHVDAYANGTPYGRAIQRRPSLPAFDLQLMAYADGNVAWVSTIEGRCWLYNIETGIDISWPIEDPGKVTTVGLSASIVAVAVDSGFFIVWKLPKPGETAPLRLSLASSLVDSLVVWGNALAILYSPSWPHDQARITIWSSEGTLQHLTVDLHESLAGAWHRHPAVNLDRKMLITCGSVILLTKANIEGCLIDFVQLNYAGKVQARGFLRTQNLSEYYLSPFPMSATSGGCTVIWAAAERHLDSDHRPIGVNFARVIYDIHNDQLSFKEIKILTSEDPWSLLGIVFFFKDVAYCKKGQSCCGPISVIDMTQLKITPARVGRPERHGEGCYQLGASNRTILCGDETYLVELSEGGFCVWCFDKNANMANEDAAYREKMVSSRAERVNAIREAEIS